MEKDERRKIMWKKAEVTMNFTGRLCGSVPLKKEIVESWLTARMPKEKPEDGRSIEEIKQEVLESIEDIEEKVTLKYLHYNVKNT